MLAERQHLPALDGVRGLAILLVLVLHLTPWGSSAADRVSAHVAGFGASGVDLFFVLSGFLITGILWTSRGPGGLKRFWIRRVLRIWPLYTAVVVGLFVVLPSFKGWRTYPMPELWSDRWYYWLHATNLKAIVQHARGLPYNTGHLWSLAVEEQFYLVWPLLVWRIRTLRGLLRLSFAAILVAWVLRLVIGGVLGDELTAYMLMPTRMDGFGLGAAIFALFALGRLNQLRRPALIAFFLSLVVALSPFNTTPWEIVAIRLAASICHGSLMIVVLTGSQKFVDRSWLRMFGKYSYGVYVVHPPLIVALTPFAEWTRTLPTLGGWALPTAVVYFMGMTSLSLIIAMASYHGYERHFLRLKDRLAPSRAPRRETSNQTSPMPAAP
jgi:peptidoglycan/LPS O-acetylase OafA/YrhL